MYHYTSGIGKSFSALAKKHYESLKAVRNAQTATYYVSSVIHKMEPYLASQPDNSHNFFNDLQANHNELLETIITGTPDRLAQVILDFDAKTAVGDYPLLTTMMGGKEEWSAFGEKVREVFDYDAFSSKNGRYTAYQFCEPLGMSVCPYCNRNYTFTVFHRGKGMVRPELDHFALKDKYPYLALSFYNLVPSCHICNSNLKHKHEMTFGEYLHPYVIGLDSILSFGIEFYNKKELTAREVKDEFGIDFFYGNMDVFRVMMRIRPTAAYSDVKKALRNVRTFKIRELYNEHKDLVREMILGAIIYNDDYVDGLLATFDGDLFRSREDVLRLVTHNAVEVTGMRTRPFSKFTKDIYSEFGVNY